MYLIKKKLFWIIFNYNNKLKIVIRQNITYKMSMRGKLNFYSVAASQAF